MKNVYIYQNKNKLTNSLSSMATEQEWANYLAEIVDLLLWGMQLSIPAQSTPDIESAITEASQLEQQDALQENWKKSIRL